MKSRVYYGEYSLKHWINLMLKRNIVLPKYQRSFVWEENDVKRLIKSLEDGQFVQPITIANYNTDEKKTNIILDGQQRLTSLLLTYLGFFPDKTKFQEFDNIASGDDSLENSDRSQKYIGWTFEDILDEDVSNNTDAEIKKRITNDQRYNQFSILLNDDIDSFLNNTFLGFSYIILESDVSISMTQQQHYFCTLFRNMNYLGTKLSSLESRRSLYFMGSGYYNFFEGLTNDGKDIFCNIKILEDFQSKKIDYVRYLSILSQYIALKKNVSKILMGFSAYSSRENFYADYVSHIVGLEQEYRPEKFNGFEFKSVFPDDAIWQNRFLTIEDTIKNNSNKMGLDNNSNAFKSWIDADYWLFGLIYWILFEGKQVIIEDNLVKSIKAKIKDKKGNNYYSKNPNRLGNLRERLDESISLYKSYAK